MSKGVVVASVFFAGLIILDFRVTLPVERDDRVRMVEG